MFASRLLPYLLIITNCTPYNYCHYCHKTISAIFILVIMNSNGIKKVYDDVDDCPNLAGPTANDGCPVTPGGGIGGCGEGPPAGENEGEEH
jgi:hypothetical protein